MKILYFSVKSASLTSLFALTISISAAHADEYMLSDANGYVIDSISFVGATNDAGMFVSTNNPIVLWVEQYDPNRSSFRGVLAVGDQPPCNDGPRTGPDGNSYPSWGIAQVNFQPGHRGFELQVARCNDPGDIMNLYAKPLAN